MKICLIAPSLNILGGQAVQAQEIATRFKKEGVDIDFLPVNPQLSGILGKCQKIKYLRTIVTSLVYIASLLQNVPRYDVLHIFSASYFSFILAPTPAILVGALFNKNIILNYRSGEAEDHMRRSEKTVKAVLKYVDILVVPSGYLQHVFAKFDVEAQAIFNVINPDDLPYIKRRQFRPVYIVSRNLEPMYNVMGILRVFRLIQERYPDAELIVLGYGSQAQAVKSLAKELRLKNVNFVGRVERQEIPRYYQMADFMLNASLIDNMPVSILEAFFSGLPVITYDTGGIPYIIKDGSNGFLIPQNDEKAMANKAIGLLEDQDLAQKVSQNAYNDCMQKYTWEVNRLKWLKLYGMTGENVDH